MFTSACKLHFPPSCELVFTINSPVQEVRMPPPRIPSRPTPSPGIITLANIAPKDIAENRNIKNIPSLS